MAEALNTGPCLMLRFFHFFMPPPNLPLNHLLPAIMELPFLSMWAEGEDRGGGGGGNIPFSCPHVVKRGRKRRKKDREEIFHHFVS
jgi:hypothetical protein